MSFNIKNIIKHRESVFIVISILVFFTFTVSYALNNISIALFIPFFFLDTKLNIKRKIHFIRANKIFLLFALFFLAQCIGYFYSEDKELAARRIVVMLPLLYVPAIIISESISFNSLRKVLVVANYLIALTFLYYLIIHVLVIKRPLSDFVHFTIEDKLGISQFYLAFIIMVSILVSAKCIFAKERVIENCVLLGFSFFILLLLGNKTALIFIVILIVICFIILIRQKKQKSALALIVFVILGSAMISQTSIVKNRMAVFVNTLDFDLETIITKNKFTETKNTLEHRILINYIAGKEILKSLPFGVGTGDYQDALNKQYKLINFKKGISEELNNHNQYLAEFLKTGLLGGILFICLIVMLLFKIHKNQFYYPIILVFFVTGCFLESYLDRQHGVVIFAFLIPYFYKLEEKKFIH